MKFSRFLSGVTLGVGLSYYLLSPKDVKIPTSVARLYFKKTGFRDLEMEELEEKKKQKLIEAKTLFTSYLYMMKEEMRSDPTDEAGKAMRVLAMKELISMNLKHDITALDNDINWMKGQLGMEEQSHEEEWKPDQLDSEIKLVQDN